MIVVRINIIAPIPTNRIKPLLKSCISESGKGHS